MTKINPDSISQVLGLATIDELARELRNRGACYVVFKEADVLAQVQTRGDYKNSGANEQRRIAERVFENNVEFIQNAMVAGGNDAIGDLVCDHFAEFDA